MCVDAALGSLLCEHMASRALRPRARAGRQAWLAGQTDQDSNPQILGWPKSSFQFSIGF